MTEQIDPRPEWLQNFFQSGLSYEGLATEAVEWSKLNLRGQFTDEEKSIYEQATGAFAELLGIRDKHIHLTAEIYERLQIVQKFEVIGFFNIHTANEETFWISHDDFERKPRVQVKVHFIDSKGNLVVVRVDGKKINRANSTVVAPSRLHLSETGGDSRVEHPFVKKKIK